MLLCRRNTEALYKFSKVFQANADQQAVYDGTTASLVRVAPAARAAPAAFSRTEEVLLSQQSGGACSG